MPQQQTLFETAPVETALGDSEGKCVATVVFPDGPEGRFDYIVPDELRDADRPEAFVEGGRRVRVPLGRGNRIVVGYCVAVEENAPAGRRLKHVLGTDDDQPLLSPMMLRLTEWMAEHYYCSRAQVMEAVVPSGVRRAAGTRQVTLLSVPTSVASRITQLNLPAKQAKALSTLSASKEPLSAAELARRAGCKAGPIQALVKKKLVETRRARVATADPFGQATPRDKPPSLTSDQSAALEAIRRALSSPRPHPLLLHGVTGSGKTEIYIRASEEVVRQEKQAIVLVPEISLTPQTVARFRARFDHVAVLHSHLGGAERHRYWQQIAAGDVEVVVGVRSAVFAPACRLGLIIIDEEHDASFKQDSAPRYHARDVAMWRSQAEGVPLVMGSATPSLETWHRAQLGEYECVALPERVGGRPLPPVTLIDLRAESFDRRSRGALSRPLHQAMEAALADGGQVILLLNRRGFSTHLQCPSCGHVVKCPDCDLSLTFHRQHHSARCHHCDYETVAPSDCPECRAKGIRFSGLGTQKLEAEVRARFPDAACLRMDSDSMQRPGSHDAALETFRRGDARILLGTQMIAKGLDFPNVTLVGVVNADTALHLPDFRAAERTFQLVTQVAGRSGRGGRPGRVIVQSFSPEHPAIVAASRHDFAAFVAGELPVRQQHGYPPYGSMVRIIVRSPVEKAALAFADLIGNRLHQAAESQGSQVRILGPAPAPIARLRKQFRFHLQLHAAEPAPLRSVVDQVATLKSPDRRVQWAIDVDPIDMM